MAAPCPRPSPCASASTAASSAIHALQARAHGSIDSFYSAELGVYRPLLRDELERLALPELSDVLEVMRELPDVPADLVPQDSLLREFIGGSTLPY